MTQNSINTATTIVQIVTATTTSLVTCNVAIPFDDSIPQQIEGVEVITATITPISSTSTLVITFDAVVTVDATGANSGTIALFQDAGADAIEAVGLYAMSTNKSMDGSLLHVMTSGTTSSTTFKIRIGSDASTIYVNGDTTGNVLMGGTSECRLTIKEYV